MCGNVSFALGKFYATEHAVVVTCYSDTDKHWAYHSLSHLDLNRYSTSTAQPGLSVKTISEILLPLPPSATQARITCLLNNTDCLLDSIESNQQQLESLANQAKAKVLDLAIRGILVPQNSNVEPASVLLEQIYEDKEHLIAEGKTKRDKKESYIFRGDDNSYYEKLGDGKLVCIDDEIPFEVPESWEWYRLSNLWDLLSGRDLTPSEYSRNKMGIPYITGASNFTGSDLIINRWTDCPKVIANNGDLLITCKGTIGEMKINTQGDIHIARQIMAIQNPNDLSIEFLAIVLESFILRIVLAARGVIPGISREDILDMIAPLPPIEEQTRIADAVQDTLKTIEILLPR